MTRGSITRWDKKRWEEIFSQSEENSIEGFALPTKRTADVAVLLCRIAKGKAEQGRKVSFASKDDQL